MRITFYGKGPIAGKLVALTSRIDGNGDLVFDARLDGKDAGKMACGDTLEDPPGGLDEPALAAIEAQAAPRIARALVSLTRALLSVRDDRDGSVFGSILAEEFPE